MHIADWKWGLILAVFHAAKYWWAWVIPLAAFIAWRWRRRAVAAKVPAGYVNPYGETNAPPAAAESAEVDRLKRRIADLEEYEALVIEHFGELETIAEYRAAMNAAALAGPEGIIERVRSIRSTVALGVQRGPYAYGGENFGRYLEEATQHCDEILRALAAAKQAPPAAAVPDAYGVLLPSGDWEHISHDEQLAHGYIDGRAYNGEDVEGWKVVGLADVDNPAALADAEEDAYVIDKLAKILAEIAVIVNGPEPPLTRWSYHDLAAKVRQIKERSDSSLGPEVARVVYEQVNQGTWRWYVNWIDNNLPNGTLLFAQRPAVESEAQGG